ncbi:MAG TPA: hypothetical protein VF875_10460, partial [Anaeromyxobacter sp.]
MSAPRTAPPEVVASAAAAWPLRHPALLAAALAAAVFAGTLANRPVLDDGWAVLENPLVRSLDVARIFAKHSGYAGGATVAGTYRPLATLTCALQRALHGPAPLPFHVVNVLLHAAATALVVLLARRILVAAAPARAAAGALGAGLLFAVHPAHVEAIAPLVGRADLLAAALGLAALRLALALAPRPYRRIGAASALLAAAMLCKETAAAVPMLYVVVAALLPAAAGLAARPGLATPERRRALLAAAATAGALALALLPYLLLKPGGAVVPEQARWFQGQPPAVVGATMTRVLAEYLRILAVPWPLMTDFGYAARIPFAARLGVETALATAAWAAVLAAGVASARRAPLLGLAVLWTFVALLPVSHLVPMGALMAERLLYLPSVGVCLWAGQLPAAWRERARARRAAVALGAAVIAILAALSLRRAADWRTPERLYEAELRHAPRDPVVNNNLAVEYGAGGDQRRALERLDVALRAAPGYWRGRVNRALALHRLGDDRAAAVALARAREVAPEDAGFRRLAAGVLVELRDLDGALADLAIAARLDPEDPRNPLDAGRLLLLLGRLDEAR